LVVDLLCQAILDQERGECRVEAARRQRRFPQLVEQTTAGLSA
jgi:hypothetical protein